MRYLSQLLGIALILVGKTAAAQQNEGIRVIVKFKQQQAFVKQTINQLTKSLPFSVNSANPMAGDAFVLTIADQHFAALAADGRDKTEMVLQQLRKNPQVLYAVKDRKGYIKPMLNEAPKPESIVLSHELQWDEFSAPAGIMLESQPGLRDGAWAYTTGSATKPIIIAVLDTGIALNPGVIDNLLINKKRELWGWNFAANNNNLIDETTHYHGTHVAGIIAGVSDVMTGVGEHLKIMTLKITDKTGMFYESQVINALHWSVGGNVPGFPFNPYPAKVLNMSFGVDEKPGKEVDHCDQALQEALDFVEQRGATLIVAAGNDRHYEHFNAPAACAKPMKVAATGPEGLRAYYSNFGPSIDFAAPGGDVFYGKTGAILSTVNPDGGYQGTGFDFYQGTSMAAPHAAGTAGLIYAARDGKIKPDEVKKILIATTHAFGNSNDVNKSCVGSKACGHGIIDAENAVKAALAKYDKIISLPLGSDLTYVACEKGGYQAVFPASFKAQPIEVICQEQEDYQKPVAVLENDKLIARYGKVDYLIDTNSYRSCQIIGIAGIGCYK